MSATINDWLEAQRIKGGPHGFECIGIIRMQQVWEAAREDLLQQLSTAQDENDELRQQLAAALAACKVKDEALEAANNGLRYWMDAFPLSVTEADNEEMLKLEEALAIQPDDSALKTWLGEPIGEVKKHTGSLKDMAIIVWSGEQPAEGTKLYSPKGLK